MGPCLLILPPVPWFPHLQCSTLRSHDSAQQRCGCGGRPPLAAASPHPRGAGHGQQGSEAVAWALLPRRHPERDLPDEAAGSLLSGWFECLLLASTAALGGRSGLVWFLMIERFNSYTAIWCFPDFFECKALFFFYSFN